MKQLYKFGLILTACLYSSLGIHAQGVVKTSKGEAKLNLTNEGLTPDQGCQKCQELAQLDAIERAFGRVMVQGNYTYIQNIQENDRVETTQIFNMMAESLANGEWMGTLRDSCYSWVDDQRGEIWISCNVKGKVRKLEKAPIDLRMEAMDCTELNRCETESFKEGEKLYIAVTSPIQGYITLYLSLGDSLQKLLPYYTMPKGMERGIPIAPHQTYVFFSPLDDHLGLGAHVHELELFADSPEDLNRLYLIYSETPLNPPLMQAGRADDTYVLPMEIDNESFQKWLARQSRLDKQLYVVKKDITIRK